MKLSSSVLPVVLISVVVLIAPAVGDDGHGVTHPPVLIPKVEPGKVWSSTPPPPPPFAFPTETETPDRFIYQEVLLDAGWDVPVHPARLPVSSLTSRRR